MSKLREAYDLIKDPEHWIAGVAARTDQAFATNPFDSRAVAWCAWGALIRVGCSQDDMSLVDLTASQLFPDTTANRACSPFVTVNDTLGHEAVMQVFQKAIVEQEGSL